MQLVTHHLLRVYRDLQALVSPDNSYHRYRHDTRVIHQSPIVPHLSQSSNIIITSGRHLLLHNWSFKVFSHEICSTIIS